MHSLSRPCPEHGDRAATDARRWLSMHRTSMGTVVYYRCTCGRPAVGVHPAARFTQAANGFAARDRMLAGTGATARMCTIDGVSTSLTEIGTGPPFVLLHGGIECGGAFWAPVLARLGERHRVVVPDLPGFGESAPVDTLDVDRFAGWFDGLLRVAYIERPTVVAHSLGGSLAACAATRWAGRVRRLVICAGPAVGPYRMSWRLRYLAMRFALRPTRRNGERYDRFALRDLDAIRRRNPGWYAAYVEYNLAQASKPHVKQAMSSLVEAGTKTIPGGELDGITAPVSLLWGRDDRMVPLRTAQIASARHGWPLHVVDDAAHVPYVEQPERFVEALARIETGS
jgi:pimeloyl-ACP methyl ester carboxylesterase